MTSIADIRKMISSGNVEPSDGDLIAEGNINNSNGNDDTYKVLHGWDLHRANSCDKLWGTFNLDLIAFIQSKNYSEDELSEVVKNIHIEDHHWDWLAKSCIHSSDEYDWFYLDVDGVPQAACLIYHPKQSVVEVGDIFYIEYVAVAPWNRPNPMHPRTFCGAGSLIIRQAMKYAVDQLGLRYGFSLHSLSKAKGFYEKIGMVPVSNQDKGPLSFYEMTEESAKEYLEAS